ncbi:hypothetical protein WJ970_12540 [Achromobacter xylosoxidans]
MRRRAETISDYFVERDAKAIVVACNTARTRPSPTCARATPA